MIAKVAMVDMIQAQNVCLCTLYRNLTGGGKYRVTFLFFPAVVTLLLRTVGKIESIEFRSSNFCTFFVASHRNESNGFHFNKDT